jgi:hypothetical protein
LIVGEPAPLPPVTVAGWVNEPAFRVESGSLRRKDRSSGGKVSRIRSEQAKDEGERTRQETQYKKAVGATSHVPCAGFVPIEAKVAMAHVPCAGFVPIEAEVAGFVPIEAKVAMAHVPCAGFVPIEAKVAMAHVPCAGFVPIEAEVAIAHVPCAIDWSRVLIF